MSQGRAMSSSAAAAAGFPKWVLLEPYVFRRDDDDSFPDGTEAPISASGTTSSGADIRIAFSLAEPPLISRLYAKLPGFPGPDKEDPLQLLAAHGGLALFYIIVSDPSEGAVQNLFIFRADMNKPSSSSLRALPPCTEPRYMDSRSMCSHSPHLWICTEKTPRLLDVMSLGLWCGGQQEEFVVAELTLRGASAGRTSEAFADICFLRSSSTGNQLGRRKWNTVRLPILHTTDDDLRMLYHWQTDAVIPFQQFLCWIDYHQGVLFWNVSSKKAHGPNISFRWFPPDQYSLASPQKTLCSGNGGVSVAGHGSLLKFVNVARHDGRPAYKPLKPGTGFTITCHTFMGGSVVWKKDYTVTSDDLPDHLQRGLPMFPRVDIVKPQVVHSLFIGFGQGDKDRTMSLLSIDMSTKAVESFYPYIWMGTSTTFKLTTNNALQTWTFTSSIQRSCLPFPGPYSSVSSPGSAIDQGRGRIWNESRLPILHPSCRAFFEVVKTEERLLSCSSTELNELFHACGLGSIYLMVSTFMLYERIS